MRQTISHRCGHSMAEMVVVMSILAGMVAISWPMLRSPMDKVRLQSAAQEVSTELAKARLKAMQSGVAQVFKVQLHSGKFRVVAVNDDRAEGAPDAPQPSPAEQAPAATGQDHSPLTDLTDALADERELPDGIEFEEPIDDDDDSESPDDVPPPVVASDDEEEWTDVAVFYPNGATSDAVVGLHGEPDLHVEVKLSGLTRTAKVGEAHRVELR